MYVVPEIRDPMRKATLRTTKLQVTSPSYKPKLQVTTDELRPISLTPTVSKILEGFVFKCLSEQILPYIDPYQFGNVKKSLSWDQHVTYICSKASKRLYAIRLLKRSGVSISDLTHIFCSVVRPILEYGCQIWHFSLTEKQSNQIEQIQRRATKNHLIRSDIL